jgi:acyl-CoA thioesterase-1
MGTRFERALAFSKGFLESFMRKALFLLLCWIVPAAATAAPELVVFGDSLSSGYGLATGKSWVNLLESRLRERGYAHRVVNASVSGETTLGGKNRIARVLAEHQPAIVIVELGGNDGLRGLGLDASRSNLSGIVRQAKEAGAKVLLVGIRLPPNYGRTYTEKFQELFADVAAREQVPLVPFLLEGFAEHPEYFQPDGIHPDEGAQPLMLDNVWPALMPLLGR